MAFNDETFIECAEALGQRMLAKAERNGNNSGMGSCWSLVENQAESELDELVALGETLEEQEARRSCKTSRPYC